MNAAYKLPDACVFSIFVDSETVEVTWTAGRIYDVIARCYLSGRQDERASGGLMAVETPDSEGVISRVQVDGRVTDSARDAVLWASELALGSKGEFRRPLEIPHAVILAALANDAHIRAKIVELEDRFAEDGPEQDPEVDGEDNTWPEGWTVQHDPSGQGHAWRDVEPEDVPADIAEEIHTAIMEDGEGDEVRSNGLRYRWRRDPGRVAIT